MLITIATYWWVMPLLCGIIGGLASWLFSCHREIGILKEIVAQNDKIIRIYAHWARLTDEPEHEL